MAKTFTSNTYDGRYLKLTITETVNVKQNTSTLSWKLESKGGSVNYYSIAATTVTINDVTVYSKGGTSYDKTKKDVVKTCVQAVEQLYKDLHGEDKLNKALESASEMLESKGITVSDIELRMLIEATVGEFNEAFGTNASLANSNTSE